MAEEEHPHASQQVAAAEVEQSIASGMEYQRDDDRPSLAAAVPRTSKAMARAGVILSTIDAVLESNVIRCQ